MAKFDTLQDHEFRRDEWAAREHDAKDRTMMDQTGEHKHCWHTRPEAASYCCECEGLPCNPQTSTTTRPAPDAGEWRVVYDPKTSHPENYHIRERGNGDCIAHTATEQDAGRIVHDHVLAGQVEQLVAALRKARAVAQIRSDLHERMYGRPTIESWTDEADAVLSAYDAAVKGERG